jgi:hypothetical protein
MLLHALVLLGLLLFAAAPLRATTIVTLALDPEQSWLLVEDVEPLFGPVALSGLLSIAFDPDPLAATSSFRVVALEATSADGVVLSLDESAADAGSGASGHLDGDGTLFFQSPLLFETLLVPGFVNAQSVGVSPSLGGYFLDPGLSRVESMFIRVDNHELGDQQLLSFLLVAVPEPASVGLLASAWIALHLWRRRHRASR